MVMIYAQRAGRGVGNSTTFVFIKFRFQVGVAQGAVDSAEGRRGVQRGTWS